jgi:hypothetical protein
VTPHVHLHPIHPVSSINHPRNATEVHIRSTTYDQKHRETARMNTCTMCSVLIMSVHEYTCYLYSYWGLAYRTFFLTNILQRT